MRGDLMVGSILLAQGQTQTAVEVSNIPTWMAGAMAWWLLTIGAKAVGQRFIPGALSETIKDAILDALTLLFAIQVALSFGQAPLVESIVSFLRNLVQKIAGGAEIAGDVTGAIVGIVFAVLMALQGWKFAKEDEKSSAWRPLALFGLFALITLQNVPIVKEWFDWLAANITVKVANGLMAGIGYAFDTQFLSPS